MAKRCCKCKGRKQNGQLKKGYTLKGGRVVKATATKDPTQTLKKTAQ
ncbi:hypothetical protein [Vibrio sp. VPAP30]|nr:hypothetical protein [Vibrio sp. VPAP30]